MAENMVKFLMPDGTEVSNDPRFGLEEALTKSLNAQPNRGDVGVTHEEQLAQTQVEHAASLNSGQPGVGENAAPEDPVRDAHGPLGSPAQQRQVEDVKKAEEAGGDATSTTVDDAEPVDSNEEVEKVRKARAERLAAYKKAVDKLNDQDEEPGDPSQPLSEWSGRQLQAEVARRNAEEGRSEDEMIEVRRGMKKADVIELLEADAARGAGAGVTGAAVTQDNDES